MLTKKVFFCHFLKKTAFLIKFDIKNGFSDSFPFQKCILLYTLQWQFKSYSTRHVSKKFGFTLPLSWKKKISAISPANEISEILPDSLHSINKKSATTSFTSVDGLVIRRTSLFRKVFPSSGRDAASLASKGGRTCSLRNRLMIGSVLDKTHNALRTGLSCSANRLCLFAAACRQSQRRNIITFQPPWALLPSVPCLCLDNYPRGVSLFKAASLFFPTTTILWVLLSCLTCPGHYAPNYAQDATHHAILQSRTNTVIIVTTNWAPILLGTLTSHLWPLLCFMENLWSGRFAAKSWD